MAPASFFAPNSNLQLKICGGSHDYEGCFVCMGLPFHYATLEELYHNIWTKSEVLGLPAGVFALLLVLVGMSVAVDMRIYFISLDSVLIIYWMLDWWMLMVEFLTGNLSMVVLILVSF